METDPGIREEPEDTGALNDDNPTPPDEAGQKGAGSQTGAIGGEQRTEPEEEGAGEDERP